MEEKDFFKKHDLQQCEYCERHAHFDLMHSIGEVYVCEICYDSSEITQN